jgi:RNA polymerase sigma-70 factor, ECF subfamily
MESRVNDLVSGNEEIGDEETEDVRLRLIFTCCHPALPPEGQVALTLREICGLTTEEIGRAFLVTPVRLAQRIVRAKAKIRETPIPYEVPTPQELPERLDAVLQDIYLVLNEGYSAAAGAEVTRGEGHESCCTAHRPVSGADVWQHFRDSASRGQERSHQGK